MRLNRKYADLRHAPDLDPRLRHYDPTALPQALVTLGPNSREKLKGGHLIGAPGFTWALYFFPGAWYFVTGIHGPDGELRLTHVDLCTPAEPAGPGTETAREGVLSVLDLKLDLLLLPGGEGRWLDEDEYRAAVRAGLVPLAWQEAVRATVALLDRGRVEGSFPPPVVRAPRRVDAAG